MGNITIDILEERDLPAITGIQPEDWGDITTIHRFYLAHAFCYSVKAVAAESFAGIGTAIIFNGTAWLAHIIVGERFRRQGIGGLIVEHLLDYARNTAGCSTVSLNATDMGYPVYLKHGFEPEAEYGILSGGDSLSAETGRGNIRRTGPEDYSLIVELDRYTTGESREGMIRPYFETGYVYARDGEVLGYYLPESGHGTIQAASREAGISLLTLRMETNDTAVIPVANTAAYEYMTGSGFKEKAKIRRMIYGPPCGWKPECNFSRTGGYIG